ncbi:hypothetical protein ASG22_10660 [Chryseobacterium sp. Leaf405]|uniref:hypothetical protein n=1 Tax=Chryseobacterium sp. Leaf405 TaxID=1736367 RepID=UPI000700ED4C|nr:hypothetical protein [Chryseobacterium sp. Leaf405]KQT24458.1 hypothetical protein ASG22_10660 [Chryseobacterium sp. Leaf405]
MQNIQDLKEKIFFESKNIIGILDKINNVDELSSKQDLVDKLADKISFLRLLEKNMESSANEKYSSVSENQQKNSFLVEENDNVSDEVTEEEAIFNNEFNEIGNQSFSDKVTEEEAVFNNQLNEIIEEELHETLVNFAEENSGSESILNPQATNHNDVTEEEAIFNNQLNEIDENEPSDSNESALSFVDEERILADSEPENDDDIHEEMFNEKTTEEETVFNNQLNEIDEFENEVSDDQGNLRDFEEEEKVQDNFESELKKRDQGTENIEVIPSIFDSEILDDDEEFLIEEHEDQFVVSNIAIEQGEMASESSNIDNIVSEIKNEAIVEEKQEQSILAEINDRRKIVEIDKPQIEKEIHPSDQSFENLVEYNHDKKIKLANIKGMKAVQSLFDDDHLDREMPKEKTVPVEKENTGSIIKTNIPTEFMEAEKAKPDFKLDLNDRIAFSKMLFGGSQSEMNQIMNNLNSFRNVEDAKEYLSDLYYQKKWNKVDEYAQRLWILVENKFL